MKLGDASLIQAYTSLGKSADEIAAFPSVCRNFLDRPTVENDDGEVVRHLPQLRKASKLPKISSRSN